MTFGARPDGAFSCFWALGEPPLRHGWTRLGKLVRLDSGKGPGTDFEWISVGQARTKGHSCQRSLLRGSDFRTRVELRFRTAQEGLKTAQEGLKTAQEAPKIP